MAVVNGYCTVAQLRAELSDDGDQLPEALLEKAISATSRAVERWTGRRFWRDESPVARRYRPVDALTVIVHDIATDDGLTVATDDGTGTYGTTWAAGDFLLEPVDADADGGAYAWTRVTATGGSAFPLIGVGAHPALRVTATWGWSAVPDEVAEATILRAVGLFKRKDAAYGVADFGEFGPVRITRRDADVVALLNDLVRYSTPET